MSSGGEPERVPEPKLKVRKQRSSALGRVIGSLVLLALVAFGAAGAAGFYFYTQFTAPGPLADKKVHIVEAGRSQQEIGAALEADGIISSGELFAGAAYVNSLRGQVLKPGEYEFPKSASIEQVMSIIASGKAITYKLTVPEGWTSQMAIARINENDVLKGELLTQAPAEGSIMPDTYVFRRGMTRQKLVEDMQAAQKKLLLQLWDERPENFQLRTPEELVTLASIVEKETGVAEERPVVASVFLNRLKQGIRLQSDPTIIYGLVGGKGKLERQLTRDDVASETPYNTYRIAGLPPGPIANPGRAALEAVLAPADTKYIYFVANGTGGHAFAETLAEHNVNVAKWRSLASGQASVVATDAQPAETADANTAIPAVPAEAPPAVPPEQADAAGQPAPPAAQADDQNAAAQPIPAPAASKPVESAGGGAEAGTAPADSKQPEQPKSEPDAAASAVAVLPQPKAKPEKPVAVSEDTAEAKALEPGSVIKLADRLVPIPRQKPKK